MKLFLPKTGYLFKILPLLASLPFLLPFSYLWRWPIANLGSINGLDLFLLAFILFSLFLIFQKPFFSLFQSFSQKNFWVMFFSGIFLFFSFFTALFSPAFWDGLGLWKSLFCLPIIFVWLIVFWIKNAFLKSETLFISFWLSALFLAIIGFFFWSENWLTFDHRWRLFFSSPNQLALSLAPAIFIGIKQMVFFRKTNHYGTFFLFFLGTGLIAWTLWQTHSLGAVLFIPLTALVFILFSHSKRFLFFFFIFFNLFLLLNWNFLLKKLAYQPNIPPNSTDSRIVIWQVAQKIIFQKGFGGVGLGNFQEAYLEYQAFFPPYPQWAVPHSHNLFFQIWAEMGFLPLVFFFILLYPLFIKKRSPFSPETLLLFYLLFYGLIETPLWKNDTALLFWLALFLSQIDSEQSAGNSIEKKQSLFFFVQK